MHKREADATSGLSKLGIEAFTDFVRMAQGDACIAVRIADERLSNGETVEQIFFTGEDRGFHLQVEEISPRHFHIAFGCVVDDLAGDGGTWDVVVDAHGSVIFATMQDSWMA